MDHSYGRALQIVSRIFNFKKKENDNMCFSEQISKMRKQNHLTQEELANNLGITFQAVSKWENGLSYPDITLLPTLADIFDCPIDALFEREAKPAPQEQISPQVAALTLTPELPYGTTPPQNMLGAHIDTLPWEDDNTLRVAVFKGHAYIGEKMDLTEHPEIGEYTFVYEGIEPLNISSNLNIECGDVAADASAGGNMTCGNVGCDANANGNLNCEGVGNAATAGGHLTCEGSIEGEVTAGGHVTSEGDINGSVSVGGSINCGTVNGETNAADHFSGLGGEMGSAINAVINAALGTSLNHFNDTFKGEADRMKEYVDRETDAAMRRYEAEARRWEGEARKWEGMARGAQRGMTMCDKSRFSCDSYEGDLNFGEQGTFRADSVKANQITLGACSSFHADSIQAEVLEMGENANVKTDSIDGTFSIVTGQIEADHIEQMAMVDGSVNAEHVETVIVAAGGCVYITSENNPTVEYRNDINVGIKQAADT